ncbi:MAG: 3-deoxy-manno-octulosonate cytidylyltransferase [Planctomycetota bacterium]|jgi:3-deoxy-manno-octulosonate cytidylyltransferase (CMP-KDO synthetase)|nr:3-deoxy-manno-octulosonate cytidylyltransferase [Planctomycetota bacterium]
MSIAIVVPARLESTRLANKLLLAETGLPLICHTAETAARIRGLAPDLFAKVMVAADSPELIRAVEGHSRARGLEVEAVLTRKDHQSGSDRIAEAAENLPPEIDAILNLQGDEPELPPETALSLASFRRENRPDIATLVYPLVNRRDQENSDLVKTVLGADGRALYFSRADIPFRRGDGPWAPPSFGHVGIYLYRRDSLRRFVALPPGRLERTEKLEQLRALENGMEIYALILSSRPPKGIDTREDYADFVRRRTAGLKER